MYEQLKVMVDDLRRSQVPTAASAPAPSWVSLTAGGLARWFAVTVVSPLELVRTKMQSQKMPWSQVRVRPRTHLDSEGVEANLLCFR